MRKDASAEREAKQVPGRLGKRVTLGRVPAFVEFKSAALKEIYSL